MYAYIYITLYIGFLKKGIIDTYIYIQYIYIIFILYIIYYIYTVYYIYILHTYHIYIYIIS